MAQQSFTPDAIARVGGTLFLWNAPRPAVEPARYLRWVGVFDDGTCSVAIDDSPSSTSSDTGQDLSDSFEESGTVAIAGRGLALVVGIQGAAFTEPYYWLPDNSAEVIAFAAAIDGLSPAAEASEFTITIRDTPDVRVQTTPMSAGTFGATLRLRTDKFVRPAATVSPGSLATMLRVRTRKQVRVDAAVSSGAFTMTRLRLLVFSGVRAVTNVSAGALRLGARLRTIPAAHVNARVSAGALAVTVTPRITPPVYPAVAMSAGALAVTVTPRITPPVYPAVAMSAGRFSAVVTVRTRGPLVRPAVAVAPGAMVVATRIRAFHQEQLLKDHLRLELQLPQADPVDPPRWVDVHGACLGIDLDTIAWTSDRRYAPDTMTARLLPQLAESKGIVAGADEPLIAHLLRATWRTPARLREPGVGVAWLGYLLPGRAQTVEDAPEALALEGVDYLTDLNVPCPDLDFRDRTLLEIARALIGAVPGYSVPFNTNLAGTLAAHTIAYLARVAGDDTILDLLDSLMHEHGYVLHAGVSDAGVRLVQVRRWWNETPAATVPLPTLRNRLAVDRAEIEHRAVDVEWAQIGTQENALLHRVAIPLPTPDSRGGRIVIGGFSLPFDDEGEAPFLRYRKQWIEAGAADDFDLLYASDQRVEWKGDPDLSLTLQDHEPLQSRVQVTNLGNNDTRRLYQLDIRGTAVYREALRHSVVSTTAVVPARVGAGATTSRVPVVADGEELAPVDNEYVGWLARFRVGDAVVAGWTAHTGVLVLRDALPQVPALAEAVALVPPAVGESDRVPAQHLTDRVSATALAVALRDNVTQGSWSYRVEVDADAVPPLGSMFQLEYPDLGIDRLCQLVRVSETLGEDTPLATVELVAAARFADVAAVLPAPSVEGSSVESTDGAPGVGPETLHAITSDTVTAIPSFQRPLDAWAYHRPATVNGLRWTVDEESADPGQVGWRVTRLVTGAPEPGTIPNIDWGEWGEPAIVQRPGADGRQGNDGSTPNRPPGVFFVARSFSSWSISAATSATSFDGGPIVGDRVTQYNAPVWAETRRWTGGSWVNVTAVVDGNLLVRGSVEADALQVGILNALLASIGTGTQRVQISGGGFQMQNLVNGVWVAEVTIDNFGGDPTLAVYKRNAGRLVLNGEGLFAQSANLSTLSNLEFGNGYASVSGQIRATRGHRFTAHLTARPCSEDNVYDFLSPALAGFDQVLVTGGATTNGGLFDAIDTYVFAEAIRTTSTRIRLNAVRFDTSSLVNVNCDNGSSAVVFTAPWIVW